MLRSNKVKMSKSASMPASRRALNALKAPFVPGPAQGAAPGRVGWRPGVAMWSGAIAALHTGIAVFTMYPVDIISWAYPLASAGLALLCLLLIPGQLSSIHRWVAVLALSMISFPAWMPIVLVVGQGWVLYRAWTEVTASDFKRRGAWLRNFSGRTQPAGAR